MVGALGGALNGFLVTVVGLPSLAVTIGTLALFRGLAVGILGTRAVTGFPSGAQDLVSARFAGTGIPVVMAVFVVAGARVRGRAARDRDRPARLRHRAERRGGPVRRRPRRTG